VPESRDPLASVVVSTYNRPRFLARALDSLAAQLFRDFEVIVVNDGGLSVASVVEAPRPIQIRLFEHETNMGRAKTQNHGLAEAKGRWVCFLNDDDIYFPHHLAVMVTTAEALARLSGQQAEPKLAIYSYAIEVTEDQEGRALSRVVCQDREFSRELLLVDNPICLPCMLAPTKLLSGLGGFDPDIEPIDDWDLWLRLSELCEIRHLSVPTAEWRRRDTAVAGTNSTLRERFRWYQALVKLYAKHPLPATSPLQVPRAMRLEAERRLAEQFGYEFSVLVACRDPGPDAVKTLESVKEAMAGRSYEVILLTKRPWGWEDSVDPMSSHVLVNAVGEVPLDEAWRLGRERASGARQILLCQGEQLGMEVVAELERLPVGSSARASAKNGWAA